MVENILTKKTGKLTLLDAGTIAIAKPLIEAGYNLIGVGNNNLISSISKILIGGVSMRVIGGNIGSNISTAMLVSGVDDLVGRFIPALVGGAGRTAQNVRVVGGSDANQGAGAGFGI